MTFSLMRMMGILIGGGSYEQKTIRNMGYYIIGGHVFNRTRDGGCGSRFAQ